MFSIAKLLILFLAEIVAVQNPADMDALLACEKDGMTVEAKVQELFLAIRENIKVRRFARFEGKVVSYVHAGGKIGVLVNFDTEVAADNAEFVARPFRKGGVECRVVTIPHSKADIAGFAQRVEAVAKGAELVLLPAMFAADELQTIRERVGARVMVVPTTSVSLSGRSVQRALRERFVALGGTLVENDRVVALDVEKNSVQRVHTAKGVTYKAENYLLATGSFFGGGVVATQKSVYEPLAGVDVDAAQERSEWTCEHILAEQPFENFGVVVNENLHPLVDGLAIDNLYAVGAILAGSDGVREGSGGGVALCSALRAAELILEK